MVRQGRLTTVVLAFLMGCALLPLVVGCSGAGSEDQPKEGQGHTEVTKEGHEHTEATKGGHEHTEATKEGHEHTEATATEQARCEGTRTFKRAWGVFTTNDLPGCPNKGGLFSGTKGADRLSGKHGDDEVRGLGGSDELRGGSGNDVTYGGPGRDLLIGAGGEDVLYGGPGDDRIVTRGGWNDDRPDKLYCGKGQDKYLASKDDHVSSSCEKKLKIQGGPA